MLLMKWFIKRPKQGGVQVNVKIDELEIEKTALVLKLLGDKTRLSMLKMLESNECCVCEFVEMFNISQSAISQHLRKLRDLGLVKENRKGQWIFYSLNAGSEMHGLIRTVLSYVPDQNARIQELEAQGLRISCNP